MKAMNHLLLLALISILVGCSKEHAEHATTAEVQLFEKGRGIRLPDDMARSLGVKTIEVAEKSFQPQFKVMAQVYRSGHGAIPASATALIGNDVAGSLRPGQAVELRDASDGSHPIIGRLVRTDLQSAAFGQAEALIEFPDVEGRQNPGASLVATFQSAGLRTGFAVPASAVLQGVDGSFVDTVNGAHFVRTPVETGMRGNEWVEIIDGVYVGDWVVAWGGEAMWMIELCALKGGTPCCPVGSRPGRSDD
jgi:hypothetical protein